jgi:RNA polymerase sigma factor (sigma-70 family)
MMSEPYSPHEVRFKAFVDRKIADQIARKQTRNTLIPWEDAAQAAYAKLWQATCDGKFRHGDLEDYCHWAARVCCFAILDFRQHSHQRQYDSLDQCLPGADIPLIDTLADEFNAMDALEQTERLSDILDIIANLDLDHPKTIHQDIWQALLHDKKQKDIAQELGVSTSDICRYWRKIREQVAKLYPGDDEPDADRRRADQPW